MKKTLIYLLLTGVNITVYSQICFTSCQRNNYFNIISKKMKVYADNAWLDYAHEAAINNAIDVSLQNGTENPNVKVIVGSGLNT
ncbi:hypothetical protein F3J23_11040 [Chryseobacterium sp. Tr-659]|uniref:hypothetical protein n=1 Tax=Chryseobacterium sp. Tr-659 TaxID=2608340 RepID=UPI0014203C0B|nr:hypothetical protein [Chryseobacterium sp. Tr-659]NIF05976.1 hypothetical protein [Chryseobacterium sp. Tr-659]